MFFPLLYSQHTRRTTYIPSCTMKTMFKVQSTYQIIALYEHKALFFLCLNCIPPIKFYLGKFRLCFIMCHFLLNNLCLIMYSNSIVQSLWEKIHTKLNASKSKLSMQFSCVLTFFRNKICF